jgi:tRNA A-37 threonylcarbamoyl transferase component Bud32
VNTAAAHLDTDPGPGPPQGRSRLARFGLGLGRLLTAPLRRWKLFLLLLPLCSAAAVLTGGFLDTSQYEAVGRLHYRPRADQNALGIPAPLSPELVASRLTDPQHIDELNRRLGLGLLPEEWAQSLEVTRPAPDSYIIEVKLRWPDPEQGANLVNYLMRLQCQDLESAFRNNLANLWRETANALMDCENRLKGARAAQRKGEIEGALLPAKIDLRAAERLLKAKGDVYDNKKRGLKEGLTPPREVAAAKDEVDSAQDKVVLLRNKVDRLEGELRVAAGAPPAWEADALEKERQLLMTRKAILNLLQQAPVRELEIGIQAIPSRVPLARFSSRLLLFDLLGALLGCCALVIGYDAATRFARRNSRFGLRPPPAEAPRTVEAVAPGGANDTATQLPGNAGGGSAAPDPPHQAVKTLSADRARPLGAPPGGGLPQSPGYEVLEEISRGGVGVVYKARQVKLKRFVALKVLLAGGHAGPEQLSRFRREAESLAQLQHPNIVQIYEVGESDGLPFLSLEYVEGGSLARRLESGPLPAVPAARLVETLARAVHAAHQRGILHRDLKPGNVLLTAEGTPKITDFGLSRSFQEKEGLTATGAVMGTPGYMAPEQAGGPSAKVGPAVDVYALGAILYEVLTGRPPFCGASLLETLDRVRFQAPVPPRELRPEIPGELEAICLKCLRKEPEQRFPTAAALADDLARFSASHPGPGPENTP